MTSSPGSKIPFKRSVSLARYTTFKIGGPADFFIEPRSYDELAAVLKEANNKRLTFHILGRGSNLLIRDRGVRGFVIRLSGPPFSKIDFYANSVVAGAGVPISTLLKETGNRNLGGCEFLAGIPGSIGGALVMNAGISGQSVASLVKGVTVMTPDGRIRRLEAKKIKFGYRCSGLSKYIILDAELGLRKMAKKQINGLLKNYRDIRRKTQHIGYPNAGCVFKNHNNKPAGMLIDMCGLKGRMAGSAQISPAHANFIVNRGSAKARDVLRLMNIAKNKVYKQFRIKLEPEIRVW